MSDQTETIAERINRQNAERAQQMIEAANAEQAHREAERSAERDAFNTELRTILQGITEPDGPEAR
jgi:hypothetical protein